MRPTSFAGKQSLIGVQWKFVPDDKKPGSRRPSAASARDGTPPLPAMDEESYDLIQQSRASRGASRTVDMSKTVSAGPELVAHEVPTDTLLASILSELAELEKSVSPGLVAALQSSSLPSHRSSGEVPASVSIAPTERRTVVSEYSSSIAPIADSQSFDTPIAWKADATSKLTFCLPPELRPTPSVTVRSDAASVFPFSHSVSRAVKQAEPKPFKFAHAVDAAPAKPRYGAWYVTPKKWSPGMGREAFELPESQDALQAMKEKALNDKIALCQAQIPHLDITRQLRMFCLREYGRVPHYLPSEKKIS